jgi:hypothetical protein
LGSAKGFWSTHSKYSDAASQSASGVVKIGLRPCEDRAFQNWLPGGADMLVLLKQTRFRRVDGQLWAASIGRGGR